MRNQARERKAHGARYKVQGIRNKKQERGARCEERGTKMQEALSTSRESGFRSGEIGERNQAIQGLLWALRGQMGIGNQVFRGPEELKEVERYSLLWYDLFILSSLEVVKNGRGR